MAARIRRDRVDAAGQRAAITDGSPAVRTPGCTISTSPRISSAELVAMVTRPLGGDQ